MSIELVVLSNYLTLCSLLLLPSSIRVFSSESVLRIRWPGYWSFSFSISPSNYIQGWFPLGLTGLTSLLSKGLSRVYVSCQWVPTNLRTSSFYMVIHPVSIFILSPNLISCHWHLMPAIMNYCIFLKGSVVWFHSRPLHRLLPLTGTHSLHS